MFKYRFPCSNEQDTRDFFYNMMCRDTPIGKGLFGHDLLRRGIHFTDIGEEIKGFYMSESEGESSRGDPLRVSFSGSFVREGNDLFFEVLIYPRIAELLFIAGGYVAISVAGGLVGLLISTVIFALFMVGYFSDIKKASAELRRMVR